MMIPPGRKPLGVQGQLGDCQHGLPALERLRLSDWPAGRGPRLGRRARAGDAYPERRTPAGWLLLADSESVTRRD